MRDFLLLGLVRSKEHPIFRLLALVLSSIEEEKRRSLQATLTHTGLATRRETGIWGQAKNARSPCDERASEV